MKENEAIVHPWINKALEKARQKVEARNFDIRKNILKFDDVMNDQRKVIFDQRVELMKDETVTETVTDMRHDVIEDRPSTSRGRLSGQWDVPGPQGGGHQALGIDLPIEQWTKEEGIADEELLNRILRRADEHMAAKVAQWVTDVIRYVEISILLQTLAPQLVERLQQDRLLDVADDVGAPLRDLRGHVLVGAPLDALEHFLVGDTLFLRPFVDRQLEVEDLLDLVLAARGVPLLRIGVFRDVLGDQIVDHARGACR